MKKGILAIVVVLLALMGQGDLCGGAKMKLYSTAFRDGERIPLKYVMPGAGGENLSPPLKWENVPEGTRSFALSCHDPHPIARNWVHWLVINIPASVHALAEGASGGGMPPGAIELVNSFGFAGYGGPQPPPGTGDHPYVFTVYALKVKELNLSGHLSIAQFREALAPYLLEEATFTGYFGR